MVRSDSRMEWRWILHVIHEMNSSVAKDWVLLEQNVSRCGCCGPSDEHLPLGLGWREQVRNETIDEAHVPEHGRFQSNL